MKFLSRIIQIVQYYLWHLDAHSEYLYYFVANLIHDAPIKYRTFCQLIRFIARLLECPAISTESSITNVAYNEYSDKSEQYSKTIKFYDN